MKPLLALLALLLFVSCERQPIECKRCHHVTTTWGPEGNYHTQQWGDFTACGDTLQAINGGAHYVFTEDGQVHSVTVTVCE